MIVIFTLVESMSILSVSSPAGLPRSRQNKLILVISKENFSEKFLLSLDQRKHQQDNVQENRESISSHFLS